MLRKSPTQAPTPGPAKTSLLPSLSFPSSPFTSSSPSPAPPSGLILQSSNHFILLAAHCSRHCPARGALPAGSCVPTHSVLLQVPLPSPPQATPEPEPPASPRGQPSLPWILGMVPSVASCFHFLSGYVNLYTIQKLKLCSARPVLTSAPSTPCWDQFHRFRHILPNVPTFSHTHSSLQ